MAAAAPRPQRRRQQQQRQQRGAAARSVPERQQAPAVSAAKLAELFAAQSAKGVEEDGARLACLLAAVVPPAAPVLLLIPALSTHSNTCSQWAPAPPYPLFSTLHPPPSTPFCPPLNTKKIDLAKLERLAAALGVPLGQAKALAFKRRALLELDAATLSERLDQLAATVGVAPQQARAMAAIQPALLLDTARSADALALGLRAICYELNCPKDEAVELILSNPSILHGREMHLSVADVAHLAMLREPRGRIVD